ncbi:signal peptidase I [Microbacterium sp.]|uniref:signal peptidase I n=1 Tax=Microbacterium sp. TaxID=51671 RepID=UPI003734F3B3
MTSDSPSPASELPAGARPRRGVWPFLRDVLIILVIAVLVSFLVKTFLVRSFYIPSGSMQNTLQEQDRILVDELTPRFGGYDRGDVVVFRDPGGWLPVTYDPPQPPLAEALEWVTGLVGLTASDSEEHLIKRIVGMPGDTVVCCNALGQVTVNGIPIDETPYLKLTDAQSAPREVTYEVTVPEDSVWVLGDNRDNSQDSRFHQDQPGGGFVPLENIVGRAFVKTWPLDRLGPIDGHHEVFRGVPYRDVP